MSIQQALFARGGGPVLVNVNSNTVQAYAYNSGGGTASATAIYSLYANGEAVARVTSIPPGSTATYSLYPGEWLLAGGSPSDYSVKVTLTSGSFSSGSNGLTWLSMTSNRSWQAGITASSGVGLRDKITVFTVQLAKTADTSNVLDTATITLYAEAVSDS